jgi:DNA invertase Pin-like site-specific DNA recombinase
MAFCEAYVLSQRHEGWQLLANQYDDGGFSGSNMERPGLKKLMDDISSGKIDTVYKVDRLTLMIGLWLALVLYVALGLRASQRFKVGS